MLIDTRWSSKLWGTPTNAHQSQTPHERPLAMAPYDTHPTTEVQCEEVRVFTCGGTENKVHFRSPLPNNMTLRPLFHSCFSPVERVHNPFNFGIILHLDPSLHRLTLEILIPCWHGCYTIFLCTIFSTLSSTTHH